MNVLDWVLLGAVQKPHYQISRLLLLFVVCSPPVCSSLVDSLGVLVPIFSCEPGGPLSPFSEFTTSSFLSLPVFLPLSVMQRLIHIYIHAHIQSHPHIHVESSLCVPCMALCCGHNTRGQAMRSHSTGELQAWPNLHHPHRTRDKQSCSLPPPARYIFLPVIQLKTFICAIMCIFFFPDRHYYRKLWFLHLLPCISTCLLLPFLPPRVRFLHPSHQSLCPQSDLKTADSCRSCVCGPFRKLYSPWNQARLDGFPASGDSPSAYQLFMSLKLGDDCRGYVWYVQVRKTDKHQCLKSGAHVFMLMWPWKQKTFTITEQQTDTQC